MEKSTFSTVTQKYLDSYAGILDTMTGTMNSQRKMTVFLIISS